MPRQKFTSLKTQKDPQAQLPLADLFGLHIVPFNKA